MLTWPYATLWPTSRSPPDLVADRPQHRGNLIQPIGWDEDEVAVVARNHQRSVVPAVLLLGAPSGAPAAGLAVAQLDGRRGPG